MHGTNSDTSGHNLEILEGRFMKQELQGSPEQLLQLPLENNRFLGQDPTEPVLTRPCLAYQRKDTASCYIRFISKTKGKQRFSFILKILEIFELQCGSISL